MILGKINKVYINICLAILKIVDPWHKPIGRPNKYDYIFYLKHIINITTSGLSCHKLGLLLSLNTEDYKEKIYKMAEFRTIYKNE